MEGIQERIPIQIRKAESRLQGDAIIVDFAKLSNRITARKQAAEVAKFVDEYIAALPEINNADAKDAFCEKLVELLLDNAHFAAYIDKQNRQNFEDYNKALGVKQRPKPMDDYEVKMFGEQTMAFGKHAGKCIKDIPLKYLEWFADQDDDLRAKVTRYLLSKKIATEYIMAVDPASGESITCNSETGEIIE